ARGIDSAAHKGSLAVEASQIAVLGTGIDTIYPPENKELFDKILEKNGVVVTEFPPNTPPLKRNFPQRNRIIAGVAFGTLIVEAEEVSGSLVTGRFTLETGRELFCIPHNITTKSGVGPNFLIQKGAKLVMRTEDIIEEMPDYLKKKLIRYNNGLLEGEVLPDNLSEEEKKVLSLLKFDEERSIDALCELSGLSMGKLLSNIASLKIKGLCAEHPGGRYSRKENR
ncbi:MAG: DNA-protecting protein DprA, partial [Acidobacteria bacterium]|nr:DNA-protecting protein DprA [Acidobacteriota bacterium]